MIYPFKFKEMNLTQKSLDVLGFGKYNDKTGTFGYRRLTLPRELSDTKICEQYELWVVDETEDEIEGYGYGLPKYCPEHMFCRKGETERIYFLHDLLCSIKENCSDIFYNYFIELTKGKGINMYCYIESFLNYQRYERNKTNITRL